MSTLSVRFPDSVHDAVKSYAREDDISINQFVISAVIEKLTALDTEKYIENRGLRGSKEKSLNVLKKAPHVQPRQKDVHTRRWSDKAKEYGISDIRLCGGPEKNKVDKKIKKDARRLITKHKNVDIVCIATSDSDYVDIIRELRSMGKRVVVIGEKQASESLRTSCNRFVEI